jgi:hypothetical protein
MEAQVSKPQAHVDGLLMAEIEVDQRRPDWTVASARTLSAACQAKLVSAGRSSSALISHRSSVRTSITNRFEPD